MHNLRLKKVLKTSLGGDCGHLKAWLYVLGKSRVWFTSWCWVREELTYNKAFHSDGGEITWQTENVLYNCGKNSDWHKIAQAATLELLAMVEGNY